MSSTRIALIGSGMLILLVVMGVYASRRETPESLPTGIPGTAQEMAGMAPTASSTATIPTWTATLQAVSFEASATQGAPPPTMTNTPAPTEAPPTTPAGAPSPTSNTETPTPALACDQAEAGDPFDVTIPNDTVLLPGQTFIKTWRFKNTGSCTWNRDYSLVWIAGEPLGTSGAAYLAGNVPPGGSIDVSIEMRAPDAPGGYMSHWTLRNPEGSLFGLGANGGSPFWLSIQVAAPTPASGSIGGRVILNGAPAAGVNLALENQEYATIASVQTGAEGTFSLSNLAVYPAGYNLVFTQEANPQFAVDQVVSWSWIGPIPLGAGASVALPDLEIGLAGFSPISPAPDSSTSAASISPSNPMLFDWAAYAGATSYWVDLSRGEEQTWVWQSALVNGPPVAFDGLLFGGATVQPGDYWWGVGALKPLGSYTQTVYSYLVGFSFEP